MPKMMEPRLRLVNGHHKREPRLANFLTLVDHNPPLARQFFVDRSSCASLLKEAGALMPETVDRTLPPSRRLVVALCGATALLLMNHDDAWLVADRETLTEIREAEVRAMHAETPADRTRLEPFRIFTERLAFYRELLWQEANGHIDPNYDDDDRLPIFVPGTKFPDGTIAMELEVENLL